MLMFEKITQLAEATATHVSLSRRGFLGGLGQTALGAASVLAGLSVLSTKVQGAQKLYFCSYWNGKKCPYANCGLHSGQYCGGCPDVFCCILTKSSIGTC
jgi:hypothetical protein